MATKEVYCKLKLRFTFTGKPKVDLRGGSDSVQDSSVKEELVEAKTVLTTLDYNDALNYMGSLGWELVTRDKVPSRLMDYIVRKK